MRIFVPGFDFPEDPQAVALPLRRALVEAVVGRQAQLGGVRALEQVSFAGLVPARSARRRCRSRADGTVRAGRRALRGLAPQHVSAELARLLPSVFQGEAKSAVVALSPLRYDARRKQLLLARRVLVRLLFTAREAGESGRGSRGRREPPPARGSVTGEVLARLYTQRRGLHAVSFEELFPGRSRGLRRRSCGSSGRARRWRSTSSRQGERSARAASSTSTRTRRRRRRTSRRRWRGSWWARDGVGMPLVRAAPAGAAVIGVVARARRRSR